MKGGCRLLTCITCLPHSTVTNLWHFLWTSSLQFMHLYPCLPRPQIRSVQMAQWARCTEQEGTGTLNHTEHKKLHAYATKWAVLYPIKALGLKRMSAGIVKLPPASSSTSVNGLWVQLRVINIHQLILNHFNSKCTFSSTIKCKNPTH